MSLKRDAEDSSSVENGQKKQKTENEGEWVVPEKFNQVKEELKCLPWKADETVQELITEVISKANTDAFFVAGIFSPPNTLETSSLPVRLISCFMLPYQALLFLLSFMLSLTHAHRFGSYCKPISEVEECVA
jgi:hypothetical protein